ncbi:MAG: hypothetical protein EOO91_01265 [Pedobacter sp.]|nr:MAG: hypothetical protein EOO91_01265 [Pedobacter sp.]
MKTLNLLFLSVLTGFLVSSCEKNSKEIYAHVDIKVINSQGANLLSTPAVFNNNNIAVYFVKDGKAELYNQPSPNDNKGFILIKGADGSDAIRLFLNYKQDEPTALTLIKFGDTKIDTVKGEFSFEEGSVFLKRVWLNDMAKPMSFEIVK